MSSNSLRGGRAVAVAQPAANDASIPKASRASAVLNPAPACPVRASIPSSLVTRCPSRLRKKRVKGTRLLVPRRCERRRIALLAAALTDAAGLTPLSGSSCGLGQVADADQVIDRQPEDEHPTHPAPAAMARLAQQADGLEPAEDLLHALAFPLAQLVAGVTRGALIDRTRPVRGVLGYMGRHLKQPESRDEVTAVIP